MNPSVLHLLHPKQPTSTQIIMKFSSILTGLALTALVASIQASEISVDEYKKLQTLTEKALYFIEKDGDPPEHVDYTLRKIERCIKRD